MALLDEQMVEEWLNRLGFFTMRGVKAGNDEIDLLAVRYRSTEIDYWHVEVQISYRPIGYIGGDSSARRRSKAEIEQGAALWVEKKFTSDKKVSRRDEILPSAPWRYVFVHGEVKDTYNLQCIQNLGVELMPYRLLLKQLREGTGSNSSSIASNIAEILRYVDHG